MFDTLQFVVNVRSGPSYDADRRLRTSRQTEVYRTPEFTRIFDFRGMRLRQRFQRTPFSPLLLPCQTQESSE